VIRRSTMQALLTAAAAAVMAALLLGAERMTGGALSALRLCAESVVPSLLPFFVLSSLIVRWGRGLMPDIKALGPLGLPESMAAPLILGLVCGYPVGARAAAELYDSGGCTLSDLEASIGPCSNSGPAFIVSAVGLSMLGSARLGWIMYAAHVLSAVFACLVVSCLFPPLKGGPCAVRPAPPVCMSPVSDMADAVAGAASAVAGVCVCVVFFGGATALILPHLPDTAALRAALCGFIEMTSGTAAAAAVSPSLCCAVVSWGGLSVHMQVAASVAGRGAALYRCLIHKCAHSIAAFFVCAALTGELPRAAVLSGLAAAYAAALSVKKIRRRHWQTADREL